MSAMLECDMMEMMRATRKKVEEYAIGRRTNSVEKRRLKRERGMTYFSLEFEV